MIRKLLFGASAVFMLAGTQVSAQSVSPHAIGIRFGGYDSFGGEISYQQMLGSGNRLELDLGIRSNASFNGFNINGIYQWVMPIEGNFNWYVGPGLEVGSWSYRNDFPGDDNSGFWVGIAGQIGIEYDFNIPLQLSFDWRPSFGFINPWGGDDLSYDGIALSARYQF